MPQDVWGVRGDNLGQWGCVWGTTPAHFHTHAANPPKESPPLVRISLDSIFRHPTHTPEAHSPAHEMWVGRRFDAQQLSPPLWGVRWPSWLPRDVPNRWRAAWRQEKQHIVAIPGVVDRNYRPRHYCQVAKPGRLGVLGRQKYSNCNVSAEIVIVVRDLIMVAS